MVRRSDRRGRALYMISVAAELSGLHPQTLRIYERKQLIDPQRSAGNTRLYSDEDIERLRVITALTEEGVNLAGVARILAMRDEAKQRQLALEEMRERLERTKARARIEIEAARRVQRGEIVHVRRGGIVRHREG